jgi:hypothetical protein
LLGQTFKLQVRAALGAAQTFQWFKGTTPIAGATGTEFAVDAAQLTDAGSYFVRVTNPAGMVQSATVVVAVNVPPSITTQPVAMTVKEGSAGDSERGGAGFGNAGLPVAEERREHCRVPLRPRTR